MDLKKVQGLGRCWAGQVVHPVVFPSGCQKWILKGFREDVIWGHQEEEHPAVSEISPRFSCVSHLFVGTSSFSSAKKVMVMRMTVIVEYHSGAHALYLDLQFWHVALKMIYKRGSTNSAVGKRPLQYLFWDMTEQENFCNKHYNVRDLGYSMFWGQQDWH